MTSLVQRFDKSCNKIQNRMSKVIGQFTQNIKYNQLQRYPDERVLPQIYKKIALPYCSVYNFRCRNTIKFKTTFKNAVYEGFINRQWKQTWDDDWNVIWCEKQQVDWVYQKHRILPHMKINHFRGWYQLCRKDMLNKNLKKYKRGLDKQNNKESDQYDFLPPTYQLPSEYVIFFEDFKRTQNDNKSLWIMKPTSKCQGKGIFIFNKIGDVSRWKSFNRDSPPEPYVCQRYLLNPLLFGGRKFDMRIYALCTSYNPLTIYLYRAGFARFAHERYDNSDTDNLYKHLTNVAININAPNYVKRIGGKWFLQQLKKFMLSKMGIQVTNTAFHDIQRSVQKLVTNCINSFQLYGFDFIFDNEGKAWLLQVNGGPSMTANTKQDMQLKVGIIDDVMTVINVEGILKGDQQVVGGFDLIYKNKEVSIGAATFYTSMLGCKNNRIDNLKKLARATAFRLAKEFQQKSKGIDSNKKIENKFTIKTSTKIDKSKIPSKSTVIDSRRHVQSSPAANQQQAKQKVRPKADQQQQQQQS